jgi:hypothetical protein
VARAFTELQAAAKAGDSGAYANATVALTKQLVTIFTQASLGTLMLDHTANGTAAPASFLIFSAAAVLAPAM